MTSNSFTAGGTGTRFADRRSAGTAGRPPVRVRAPRAETLPQRRSQARRMPRSSARSLAAGRGPPESQRTATPAPRRPRRPKPRYANPSAVETGRQARGSQGPRPLPARCWSLSVPSRLRVYPPHRFPQVARLFARIPGTERTPLGFVDPTVVIVGDVFEADFAARVPGEKADAGVELGVVGGTPGLDPGPPDKLRFGIQASFLKGLAPGASREVLTRLEHAARVLPEPFGRLATPQEQRPGLVAPPEIHDDRPGTEVGADGAGAGRNGWWGLGKGVRGGEGL